MCHRVTVHYIRLCDETLRRITNLNCSRKDLHFRGCVGTGPRISSYPVERVNAQLIDCREIGAYCLAQSRPREVGEDQGPFASVAPRLTPKWSRLKGVRISRCCVGMEWDAPL